ncbi:hypothetical protein RUND412_003565 [Rhizina undulata]
MRLVSRFLQLLNQLCDCKNLGEELIVKKPVGAKSPRQVLLDAVAFVSCSERKSGKVSAVAVVELKILGCYDRVPDFDTIPIMSGMKDWGRSEPDAREFGG